MIKCLWCGHVMNDHTQIWECRICGETEFDYSAERAESEIQMNIVNLTPHEINIHMEVDPAHAGELGDTEIMTVAPSGNVARVAQSREALPSLSYMQSYIPVFRSTFGEIEGLPEPLEGTIYVVSGLVLSRTNRPDVFAPGEAVRDSEGRIIGCKGLSASG